MMLAAGAKVRNLGDVRWCAIEDGYPCQPFSVAGRKLGDKDPRHLWPHIARIVHDIKAPLCFFENVGGHLRLGFEQVHDDLRSMGLYPSPFSGLPKAATISL
jgi:DNA (cytosine-5)-methyltransferase 1